MYIGLRPGSLEVVAGATASVAVSIVDTDASGVAQPVRVTVLGLPAGWVRIEDEAPVIPAGGSVTVTVSISVPEDYPSGDALFVVGVISSDAGGREAYERLPVRVVDRPSVRVSTDRSVADGGRRSRVGLVVTSDAAAPVVVAPVARDQRGTYEVTFDRSRLELEPGTSQTLGVAVSGDRPIVGRGRRSTVTLGVNSGRDVVVTVPVVRRPFISWWMVALVIVAMAAVSTVVLASGWVDRFLPADNTMVVEELPAVRTVEAFRTVGAVVVTSVTSSAAGRAVPGARVDVFAADDPVIILASAATDSDGVARVRGVPAGDVVVRASAPGYATSWSGGVGQHRDAASVQIDSSAVTASSRIDIAGLVLVGDPAAISGSIPAAYEGTLEIVARPVVEAAGAREVSARWDGARWTVSGLAAPAEYDIAAVRGDTEVWSHRVDVAESARMGPISVVVDDSTATVGGVVSGSAGPIGGADVVISNGIVERRVVTFTEGEVGAFSIGGLPAPGTYNVIVQANGFATTTQQLEVRAGGDVTFDVDLEAATGSVSGRVVNVFGVGVGGVEVTVSADGIQRTAVSVDGVGDAAGRFRVDGLALPAEVTVGVASDSGRAVNQLLQLSRDVPRIDDVMIMVTPSTSSVVGTVTDEDGRAVAGARVTMSDGVRVVRTTTASQPAGAFGVSRIVPGTYTLSVERTGATTEVVQVVVPDPVEGLSQVSVDVVVGPQAVIAGQVERTMPAETPDDADDSVPDPVVRPAGDVTVRLHRVADAAGPASTALATATTDDQGLFTLIGFPAPVDYVVVVVDPADPSTVLAAVSVRPAPSQVADVGVVSIGG